MLKCGDCLNYRKCYVRSETYDMLTMIEPACDRFQPKGVNYNGDREKGKHEETRNQED